jgi:chemotaxis signal transduction protein
VFTENEITYVTGVGKLNNRLIILVDLQKVLTRGELRKIGDALEAQEVAN